MEGGDEAGFRSLAGEGQIVVTVEATDRASSYQGVVPITGNSLAESLEAYFHQSEQLPTRVLLAASSGVVAGMLVQRIPGCGRHADSARRSRARIGLAKGRRRHVRARARPVAGR